MLYIFATMQALCKNTKTHKSIEWEIILIALRYWISSSFNLLATLRCGSKFQKYSFPNSLYRREARIVAIFENEYIIE